MGDTEHELRLNERKAPPTVPYAVPLQQPVQRWAKREKPSRRMALILVVPAFPFLLLAVHFVVEFVILTAHCAGTGFAGGYSGLSALVWGLGISEFSGLLVILLADLLLTYALVRWIYSRLRWKRVQEYKLICGKCGYDLTGNVSGRCPECGHLATGRPEAPTAPT